jgi:ribosomal protein S15P/S13E
MKSHILRRNTDMRARYDLNLIYQRRRRLCFYLRKQDMAMYSRIMQDFDIDERELELQGVIIYNTSK